MRWSERQNISERVLNSPSYLSKIKPDEYGTIEYLNLCMKVVSKHGPDIQHVPKEYRTNPICTASVLSCKAEGYDLSYSLKYIPENHKEKCSLVYSYSSDTKQNASEVENLVKNKMQLNFQNESERKKLSRMVITRLQDIDKLKYHIINLKNLYYDLKDVKRDLEEEKLYQGEKKEKLYFKKKYLTCKIEEIGHDILKKIKELDASKYEYFDLLHTCYSEDNSEVDFKDKEWLFNSIGETNMEGYEYQKESFETIFKESLIRNDNEGFFTKHISDLIKELNQKNCNAANNLDYLSILDSDIYKKNFDYFNQYRGLGDGAIRSVDTINIYKEIETVNNYISSVKEDFEKKLSEFNANNLTNEVIDKWRDSAKEINQLIKDLKKGEFDNIKEIDDYKKFINEGLRKLDNLIQESSQSKGKKIKSEETIKNSEGTKLDKEEVEVKETKKDSKQTKNQAKEKKDSAEIVAHAQEQCNAKLAVVKNFARLSQDMLNNAKEQDEIVKKYRKDLSGDLKTLKSIIDDMYKTKHNYVATLQYINDYDLKMKQLYVELCEKLNSPKYFDEKTIKINALNGANVKKKLEGNSGKKSQKITKKSEINDKNKENTAKNPENEIEEGNKTADEQSINTDKKQEEFNSLLDKFSKVHASYYDGNKGTRGNAHTKEEISEKLKVNRAMKRAIEKRAADLSSSAENKEDGLFDKLINPVDDKTISEVAENQAAALSLMQIMASGVYEKGGEQTRLTQKQRVALASTMQKVTELMLKNEKKQEKNSAVENKASAME